MINNLKIGIECTPASMLINIETNADIFWFHLGDNVNFNDTIELISNFSYAPNLSLIMTSGYMSEALHDKFDEVLESQSDQNAFILTAWSEDGFSEALWEFVNVHGSRPNVKLAKILIVDNSTPLQMKLLAEAASMILTE